MSGALAFIVRWGSASWGISGLAIHRRRGIWGSDEPATVRQATASPQPSSATVNPPAIGRRLPEEQRLIRGVRLEASRRLDQTGPGVGRATVAAVIDLGAATDGFDPKLAPLLEVYA